MRTLYIADLILVIILIVLVYADRKDSDSPLFNFLFATLLILTGLLWWLAYMMHH